MTKCVYTYTYIHSKYISNTNPKVMLQKEVQKFSCNCSINCSKYADYDIVVNNFQTTYETNNLLIDHFDIFLTNQPHMPNPCQYKCQYTLTHFRLRFFLSSHHSVPDNAHTHNVINIHKTLLCTSILLPLTSTKTITNCMIISNSVCVSVRMWRIQLQYSIQTISISPFSDYPYSFLSTGQNKLQLG